MKTISLKSLLLIACLLGSITASAYDFEVNGIYYNITSKSDKTVEVTDDGFHGCYSDSIVIPLTVKNGEITYSVTSINENAFSTSEYLTGLIVASENPNFSSLDGVLFNKDKTTILAYPCAKSSTIYTIPNSVTSIGKKAFGQCVKLTSVTIPNSVTSIGESAFDGCSSLTSVTIGNSVTSIGDYAFGHCYDLTSVTISNSVTSIGEGAFSSCGGLTDVTIPNSVTSIGKGAFSDTKLKEINVASGNTSFSTIDGVLFNKDKTTILAYPNGKSPTYTIPNSVTSIGDGAFSNCRDLTSVTIPNSVTSIGESAFLWCSGLTGITIPNSVTSIGKFAFSSCSGLTDVAIPNSVTSIGEGAFSGCIGLTGIAIPNSVTSIGKSVFSGCKGLKEIIVASENTSFSSLDGVLFNKDKTTILAYPCAKSSTIYTIPNSVTSIDDGAFSGCTGLTSVTIPNSVTSIGNAVFFDCESLTGIKIPSSVTSIGEDAFRFCFGLKDVVIGNSVTSIGNSAFFDCKSLTNITIPNSLTSIGKIAFACTSLEKIYNYSKVPQVINDNVFDRVEIRKCTLYVPKGSMAKYKAADGWMEFEKIQEFDPTKQ